MERPGISREVSLVNKGPPLVPFRAPASPSLPSHRPSTDHHLHTLDTRPESGTGGFGGGWEKEGKESVCCVPESDLAGKICTALPFGAVHLTVDNTHHTPRPRPGVAFNRSCHFPSSGGNLLADVFVSFIFQVTLPSISHK